MTDSIGMKLVSICKVWPRTGMRKRGAPQRYPECTPGTSEVPGMYLRYLHRGAQLISGKATHGMPCKIGQNALWYMRVMVWYKCEICDFTFWPGDTTLRAHKQNSPREPTRSFTTLLAFTACLMAKHNGQRWTPREMEIWIVVRRLCRSILRSSFGSIKLRVVLDAM